MEHSHWIASKTAALYQLACAAVSTLQASINGHTFGACEEGVMSTAAVCTRLGIGCGVCGGLLGAGPLSGICGTAAREGASGWRLSCDSSVRLTPVISSLALKGASTTANRAARPGSASMSRHADAACSLRAAGRPLRSWGCCVP